MKRKTIIIDEENERRLVGAILESAFYPNVQQVLNIEDFLNKNFRPKKLLTINNETGYSDFDNVVVMVKDGVELETLNGKQLLRMLDDKFNNTVKDDADRRKFLKQVIDDWYNGRIRNGILIVNHL
jgi:ABC-type antimicrobial peptide transport system permease subunit